MVVERGGDALRLAAVVALVGIGLVISIELRLRIEDIAACRAANAARHATGTAEIAEAQAQFHEQLRYLGTYSDAPTSCREFMSRIVEDWRRVEHRRSVILSWSREDAEDEFRARLGELALGRAPVGIQSRHNFRSHPLQDFAQIRWLNVATTQYWNTARGRRYLDNQRTGIDNGHLKVSRIFVVGKDELESASDTIRRSVDAGVRVSIVLREEIASNPEIPNLRDLSLVTHSGVGGVITPGAPGEAEVFTTNEHEVRMAEGVLRALEPYLHSADETLPKPSVNDRMRSEAADSLSGND
jgi:hypothetical protein